VPDSPGAAQAPFFEFVEDGGGADVQYTGRVPNPAGIHSHLDHLILYVLGLARVGVVQQKGAPLAGGLSAAIPLLTLRRLAMSHDIGPVTVWAMQELGNHRSSPSHSDFIDLISP
jgi:hypothetical protein